MGVGGFKAILKEFSQPLRYVKPLRREIQGIFFPLIMEDIGTRPDPEKLYGADR